MKENSKEMSDDLKNLIERVPDRFNALMVLCLSVFAVALLSAGILIKSPEILQADIKITGTRPPLVLKAGATGKLNLLVDSLPKRCGRGEYLAVIENPADWRSVRELYDSLTLIDPMAYYGDYFYRVNLSLGEISSYYSEFVQSLINYNDIMSSSNQFSYDITAAKMELQKDSLSLVPFFAILAEDMRNLSLKKKEYERDSILFSQSAILESELDQALTNYLNVNKSVLSEKMNIDNTYQSMQKGKLSIERLEYQYLKACTNAREALRGSYYKLLSAISSWETRFVLKSDGEGVVEFANLISDDYFVVAGEQVFSVLFGDNKYVGVALLPAVGAGRIRVGQDVNIKVVSYPFEEYGMLTGKVQNISMNPADEGYLIYVGLPNGLTSTTGHSLVFAETMYGRAEIITEPKRLIDKIFYRIYNILDGKK